MGQLDDVECAMAECGLAPDGAFEHRYGYVAPARLRDGIPAVLKLGPTDALEWFSGRGGVRVLAVDRERGAALIERAQAHLAAAWSIEDGEDPAHWLAVADRLSGR